MKRGDSKKGRCKKDRSKGSIEGSHKEGGKRHSLGSKRIVRYRKKAFLPAEDTHPSQRRKGDRILISGEKETRGMRGSAKLARRSEKRPCACVI